MSRPFHSGFRAMGTRLNVVIPEIDHDRGTQVLQLIRNEVHRIEALLSYFMPTSEISRINQSGGKHPVAVSSEVFGILKNCVEYAELTGGAFDITLRPLFDYWYRSGRETPDEEHQRLHEAVGMDRISLHEEEEAVELENETVRIDLGGYGKGYALEKLLPILRGTGIRNAFVSFGESSVLTLGHHPKGHCWKVGINHYLEPGTSLHTFEVNDGAVSTSSNFTVRDGGSLRRHMHVLDPQSGRPVDTLAAVSVMAPSPLEAEVLSTAFLVMKEERVRAVCRERPEIQAVRVDYAPEEPLVTYYHEEVIV